MENYLAKLKMTEQEQIKLFLWLHNNDATMPLDTVIDLNESLWANEYIEVKNFLLFKDDGLQSYIVDNELGEQDAANLLEKKSAEAYKLRADKQVMFLRLDEDEE